jgi:hypothetical protein
MKTSGGKPADVFQRQALRQLLADQHRRNIGQHHADGRSHHHGDERACMLRAQRHSGELGLVTHLGDEEGDGGGDEGTGRVDLGCFVERIRMQGPEAEGDEHGAGDPGQPVRRNKLRQPDTDRAGQGMVKYRGDEDAGDDRPRLAQLRGQYEGEQLGLVADLGDGNQRGRRHEGFHGNALRNE